KPYKSERTRDNESPFPSPYFSDKRHSKGRYYRAEVGAGIENTVCERALPLREPLGRGLDGSGEVTGLADPQQRPCCGKAYCTPGKSREHRRETPHRQGYGIADLGSDLVDEPARTQHADRVGQLKGHHNIGVVGFRPVADR